MKQISLKQIETMDKIVDLLALQRLLDEAEEIINGLYVNSEGLFTRGEATTYLWFCIDQGRMPPQS